MSRFQSVKRQTPNQLDCLSWADEVTLTGYGARVGIRVSDSSAIDLVARSIPFGWEPGSLGSLDRRYSWIVAGPQSKGKRRRFHLLYRDRERIALLRFTDDLTSFLRAHLELDLAELATTAVFIHAGVVGWKGRAILFPGSSFSGKTTLVAALVRAGATYYSDEFAVLDVDGRVYPFPRPPTIRGGDEATVTVQNLLDRAGTEALPVGLVVLTTYKPDGTWSPLTVSPGQAVLHLLENCVSARRRPEESLSVVHRVVARARVLQGERGEASDLTVRLLAELYERPLPNDP